MPVVIATVILSQPPPLRFSVMVCILVPSLVRYCSPCLRISMHDTWSFLTVQKFSQVLTIWLGVCEAFNNPPSLIGTRRLIITGTAAPRRLSFLDMHCIFHKYRYRHKRVFLVWSGALEKSQRNPWWSPWVQPGLSQGVLQDFSRTTDPWPLWLMTPSSQWSPLHTTWSSGSGE